MSQQDPKLAFFQFLFRGYKIDFCACASGYRVKGYTSFPATPVITSVHMYTLQVLIVAPSV